MVRETLVAWLGGRGPRRPRLVDAPPPDAKGLGRVESPVAVGSIVLAGPKGPVTVVWKPGEKDRTRALPPGTYRLRSTKVERRKDGVHWFLSSSGPLERARKIEVAASETTRIDVEDAVHFKGGAKWKDGALELVIGLMAGDKRGLSIFKAGRRVPVGYQVLSEKGAVLASGTARYG